MKRFLLVTLILPAMLLMFFLGCEPDEPYPPPNIEFGEMTDARDGKTYKTIEIGAQTWMAENLNYKTGNSWCYNNDNNNCNTYGRLYDWNTALSACPSGWHLPSDGEWHTLTDYLGGVFVAGGKMKSTSNLWDSPNTDATNESGWSGLPGGYLYYGYFSYLGRYGGWWSASEYSSGYAWFWNLFYSYGYVSRNYFTNGSGFSVRCLRD